MATESKWWLQLRLFNKPLTIPSHIIDLYWHWIIHRNCHTRTYHTVFTRRHRDCWLVWLLRTLNFGPDIVPDHIHGVTLVPASHWKIDHLIHHRVVTWRSSACARCARSIPCSTSVNTCAQYFYQSVHHDAQQPYHLSNIPLFQFTG